MELRTLLAILAILIVVIVSAIFVSSSGILAKEQEYKPQEIPPEEKGTAFSLLSASCSGSTLTVRLRNEREYPLAGTYFLEIVVDGRVVDSATDTVSIPPGGVVPIRTFISEHACVPGAEVRVTIAGITRSTTLQRIAEK